MVQAKLRSTLSIWFRSYRIPVVWVALGLLEVVRVGLSRASSGRLMGANPVSYCFETVE